MHDRDQRATGHVEVLHKDGAQEPRSGPVLWIGNRNEFDAVMVDGALELWICAAFAGP